VLSRRDLLKTTGSLALAPLLPFRHPEGGFAFAFYSDTHVGLKSNIEENRLMLAEMQGIEFALNGGDVTDYGWAGEYANWWNLIKDLPFKTRHIPGNHDVRWSPLGPKAYEQGTRDPMYQSFDHKGIHFVLLDSTVPLSHWGHFESEMLRWLETDLKKVGRDIPVFVATHHWVGREGVMVDNESDLIKLLEPYNIKILLTGHGHSDLLWTINGIPATMNKGLYQGSWQRIEIDRDKSEARLLRTSGPAGDASKRKAHDLLTVPLSPTKEKRQVWAAKPGDYPPGWTESRWDDGKFAPASAYDTAGLIAGMHRLVLRGEKNRYLDAGQVVVNGSSGVLKKKWDKKLSGGIMSHLRMEKDRLYVSTMDGGLICLAAADGRQIWHSKTDGYCHSSPLVVGPYVLVGSAGGGVFCFDKRNGEQHWRAPFKGPVYSSPVFAKGLVWVAAGDGSFAGLDPASGAPRLTGALPPSNTAFVQSPLATDGARVFLGAWDKNLYAVDAATGQIAWKGDCVGNRSFAYSPAIGGPAVANGRVVVPANGNNLVCFDCETGNPIWNTSSPGDKFGYSSPQVVGGRIYVGCLGDNGEARCVSLSNGEILWTCKTGSVIYDSGPAFVPGRNAVGICSVSGLVTACDAEDGKIIGQYQLPAGHLLSTPVAEDSSIYVGSYNDGVTRFDLS
jgi:outer membrane protein assembly factor BamB